MSIEQQANANMQALAETRNAAISNALDQAALWRGQCILKDAQIATLQAEIVALKAKKAKAEKPKE